MEKILPESWMNRDSELRILLNDHFEGQRGQTDDSELNKLYLPEASSCRVTLEFSDHRIAYMERGPACDNAEWGRINQKIEQFIVAGTMKVGRSYSFSNYRVQGSWRGERSEVQILPPEDQAPDTQLATAEHPFILEFPIKESELWQITDHRRLRKHKKLTLLLNVLLAGRTTLPPRRSE